MYLSLNDEDDHKLYVDSWIKKRYKIIFIISSSMMWSNTIRDFEKMMFSLTFAIQQFLPYSQEHTITMVIDHPLMVIDHSLWQILLEPDG